MVNVAGRIAAFEQGIPQLSDDLKRFLDLAWTHRKNTRTGAYSAKNSDVYGLYARIQNNFNAGPISMNEFLNGILGMPQLPEIQCSPTQPASRDPLGNFLHEVYGATAATSGFATLTQQNFRYLVEDARDGENLRVALSRTFYHFRRNSNRAKERIYLNVKPLHAIRVMRFVLNSILRQPVRHPNVSNAKVGAPGSESRADTIVIYLNDPNALGNVLDDIAAYQHAGNHNYFEHGTTRSTKAIDKHNGIQLKGVGNGAEPPLALYNANQELVLIPGSSSFGSFRSKLIEFAIKNTLTAHQDKTAFINRVVKYFKAAGLNPRQPYKHQDNAEFQHRAQVTLNQLRRGVNPTWKVT